MYKAHKAYADAAKARFAAHRNKMRKPMGRTSLRPNFPVGTKGFPANASAFGAAASSTSVGLLSRNVLKKLLVSHLGVTKVTSNGIDILTGLIDKGVEEALDLCKEIHLSATRQGASSKTFGTDIHVEVARANATANSRLTSLAFPNAVIEKRTRIADTARTRFENMPEEKKIRKKMHSYLPSIVKAIFNKLSKAHVLNGLPKPKLKESSPAGLVAQLLQRPGGAELVLKQFGQYSSEALAKLNINFVDEDGDTFFPGGYVLSVASYDKWINYETVVMLITVFGRDAIRAAVASTGNAVDTHYGFYKQWKILKKDIETAQNGTITPQRRATMIRAFIKGMGLYTVTGNDLKTMSNAYVSLTRENYFAAVIDGMNLSQNATVIPDGFKQAFDAMVNNTRTIEQLFH
jgi:hypothetical protein